MDTMDENCKKVCTEVIFVGLLVPFASDFGWLSP